MVFRLVSPNEIHAREETWGGFTHLVKWFLVHMTLILTGLYLIFKTDYALNGVMLLGFGAMVLVYGIITTPRAAHNAQHVPKG